MTSENCDKCHVARARFRVMIGGLPITLCMHHFNESEEIFLTREYEVFDLAEEDVMV